MVLLHWTRWPPELKNTKSSNDISTLANSLISKYLHRSIPPMALNQITKMAPLNWTKWRSLPPPPPPPPTHTHTLIKKKKRENFKRHLLCSQCPDFKVISWKCSSYDPLPKLLKSSARLNKMATRAKNRKKTFKHLLIGQWPDFKTISQNCSSYPSLPKLPKWLFSAEQNGHRS